MSERFAVIIAGGRNFSDYELLTQKCALLFTHRRPTCILSGGAQGADRLGQQYAEEQGIPCTVVPANWALYGKRAGFLRNQAMLEKADALIAFWDGFSHGTGHMVRLAKEAGIPNRVIRY